MSDMNMMAEKWRIVFKLMDIDKDGKLSVKDRDACKMSFESIYSPEGDSLTSLQEDIDTHWNCIMNPAANDPVWDKAVSEDEFIESMKTAFLEDKTKLFNKVKSALKHLLSAADNNKDGIFTFDKFFKFHVAFNLAVDVIVRATFNLIGPNSEDKCSFDQVHAFYVELFIGEDKEKFEALKNAYRAVGIL